MTPVRLDRFAASICVDQEREVGKHAGKTKTHDAHHKVRINYPKILSQDTYPQKIITQFQDAPGKWRFGATYSAST